VTFVQICYLTHHLRPLLQRTVRQETTKCKAGTLPLNMYQTALQQVERLEFAPENEDQNDFSRGKGEKVRFRQGILEAISFLNMMKTPPTTGRPYKRRVCTVCMFEI